VAAEWLLFILLVILRFIADFVWHQWEILLSSYPSELLAQRGVGGQHIRYNE
jgi:hypothetical protein